MKPIIILYILCLGFLRINAQNVDTIKVFFLGEFEKKEEYIAKYNGTPIRLLKPKGYYVDSFKIVVNLDSILPYRYLPLEIYKVRKGNLENTQLGIYFEPNKKILVIQRDYRLKDQYAVEFRWFDKKRKANILRELLPLYGVEGEF